MLIHADSNGPQTDGWDAGRWASLVALAASRGLVGDLNRAIAKLSVEVPDDIRKNLQTTSSAYIQRNHINFAHTVRVMRILERADVSALVFKGPIRAHQVYGSWAVRPSQDIDILVRTPDFDTAARALSDGGIHALVGQDSRWWKDYLGEMPFQQDGQRGPIIDLHHQVQQPGGPFPRRIGAFFRQSVQGGPGSSPVRTLSPDHGLLLNFISFGKAVREEAPWFRHAHVILSAFAGMSPEDETRFWKEAKRQGLTRLGRDALHHARRLFPDPQASANAPSADREILDMAFGQSAHHALHRTRLLWQWLDGNPLARTAALARQTLHTRRGDRIRIRDEKTGRLDLVTRAAKARDDART